MRYTFGGYPESEAYTWNSETHQALGQCVFLMQSANANNRKKGWIEWYELKRHFMFGTWREYVDKFDAFRIERNAPTTDEMVEQISREVSGRPDTIPKPSDCPIPAFLEDALNGGGLQDEKAAKVVPEAQAKPDPAPTIPKRDWRRECLGDTLDTGIQLSLAL